MSVDPDLQTQSIPPPAAPVDDPIHLVPDRRVRRGRRRNQVLAAVLAALLGVLGTLAQLGQAPWQQQDLPGQVHEDRIPGLVRPPVAGGMTPTVPPGAGQATGTSVTTAPPDGEDPGVTGTNAPGSSEPDGEAADEAPDAPADGVRPEDTDPSTGADETTTDGPATGADQDTPASGPPPARDDAPADESASSHGAPGGPTGAPGTGGTNPGGGSKPGGGGTNPGGGGTNPGGGGTTPPGPRPPVRLEGFRPFGGPNDPGLFPVVAFEPGAAVSSSGYFANRSGQARRIDLRVECDRRGGLDSCVEGRPETQQFTELMVRVCFDRGATCDEQPMDGFELADVVIPPGGREVTFHVWLRETGVEQAQGITTPFALVVSQFVP